MTQVKVKESEYTGVYEAAMDTMKVSEQVVVSSRVEKHYKILLPTGKTVDAYMTSVMGADVDLADNESGLLNEEDPVLDELNDAQWDALNDYIGELE